MRSWRPDPIVRTASAIATRSLLLLATFVLVVLLAELAITAARSGPAHVPIAITLQTALQNTGDHLYGLLTGTLGDVTTTSILGGRARPVGELVLDTYPKSIALVGIAILIATAVGIPAGIVAAAAGGRVTRAVVLAVTTVSASTPSFLLAMLLLLLSAESVSRFGVRLWPSFGFGWDEHLVVPSLVLAALPLARISATAFVAVGEALAEDHVRTARAKGLTERIVAVRHALPNAVPPIVGAVAAGLSIALSTLPVVEVVYSWPGMGAALLLAIRRFDAVTAGTLLGTLAVTIAVARMILDRIASTFVPTATAPSG